MNNKNKRSILICFVLLFLLGACSPGEEIVFLETWSPKKNQLLRITIAEPAALPGCDYCRRPFFVSVYLADNTWPEEKKIISSLNSGVAFLLNLIKIERY